MGNLVEVLVQEGRRVGATPWCCDTGYEMAASQALRFHGVHQQEMIARTCSRRQAEEKGSPELAEHWISVDVSLPDQYAFAFVWHKDMRLSLPCVAEFFGEEWGIVYGDNQQIEVSDVTHWMPLPSPPDH